MKYFSEEKKYEEIMTLTTEKSGFSEQEILQNNRIFNIHMLDLQGLMIKSAILWRTIPQAISTTGTSI
ncbi:MAG: hypothetical protein ACLTCI_06055 [[Clostridium] nexile]